MKKILAFLAVLLCGATIVLAASIVSTVNKTVSQNGLPFASSPYTVTGAQAPYMETTLATTGSTTYSDGIGNVQVANLQMLYLLSDQLDVTAAFYANTAGTGSALAVSGGTSLSLQAGIPWEWDSSAGTSPVAANWLALKLTAGTTANGQASSGTATSFHARTSLSQ